MNSNDNTYFIDILTSPVENTVAKTFEKFGPNFEVNLGVIVEAIPTEWSGIFHLTNDETQTQGSCLGGRYPIVSGRPIDQDTFYIESCFHETNENAIRDGDPYLGWGHCSSSDPLPFNDLIHLGYRYQDGVMKMFINGELFRKVDTKNDRPYVIENMKLILGPGSNPIGGSIAYFALRADKGLNGTYENYSEDIF